MLFFVWSGYENRCSAIFQQVPIYRAIRPLIKALFNCWQQMDRWQYGDDLGWQDFCKSTRKAFFSTMPPFHWWKVVLDQLKCSKLYEVKMGIWCFRSIYPYQPVWDFLHFQPVNTKTYRVKGSCPEHLGKLLQPESSHEAPVHLLFVSICWGRFDSKFLSLYLGLSGCYFDLLAMTVIKEAPPEIGVSPGHVVQKAAIVTFLTMKALPWNWNVGKSPAPR